MSLSSDDLLAHFDFPFEGWTASDDTATIAEGWCIHYRAGRLEIGPMIDLNDDDEAPPEFESDEAALAHVKACAQRGLDLHARALAIHEKYGGA